MRPGVGTRESLDSITSAGMRAASLSRRDDHDFSTPLAELLRAASAEHRTFSISVIARVNIGKIYVSVGEVVHAVYGELVGSEAVDAMLRLSDVALRSLSDAPPASRQVRHENGYFPLVPVDRDSAGPSEPPPPSSTVSLGRRHVPAAVPTEVWRPSKLPSAPPSSSPRTPRTIEVPAKVVRPALRNDGSLTLALMICLAILGGVAVGLGYNLVVVPAMESRAIPSR